MNGKTIRVVEADIYVGLSKTGYTVNDIEKISKNLNKAFDKKIKGEIVDVRINVHTFDADAATLSQKASELRRTSVVETDSPHKVIPGEKRLSIGAAAIAKENLPGGIQGETRVNRIAISNSAIDTRHTEAHEVGHFLMLDSPDNPSTAEQHNDAGGIFKYSTVDPSGKVIEVGLPVSKRNLEKILENVPKKQQ